MAGYYLHRPTPIDRWRAYVLDHGLPFDGEVIVLPDCHWFSQAQAEADRLNGKQDGGQEALPI